MPGRLSQWPSWDEYGLKESSETGDVEYAQVKKAIIEEFGAEALKKSWIDTCEKLRGITDELAQKGNEVIPIVSASTILAKGVSPDEETQIRKTGCLIIRGVMPKAEVDGLYKDLETYIADNRQHITGWPKETPSILNLYNTPTQNTIRSHPDHLKVQKLLNGMWRDDTGRTSPEPLLYLDGVRDRPPHQPFLGLGPHIDAGSFCRWADPTYRKAYGRIFSGDADSYDAWDLTIRQDAVQDLYKGPAHSSVFRSFQGWTALTSTAPNEGTLLLFPNVATAAAYFLLRPFFQPPADPAKIMDASQWTLDEETSSFPGTFKDDSQLLSRTSHPHLRLEECMVCIPALEPGDTIWWHSDVCHAVEPEHSGDHNASVVYIAACPTTKRNKDYIEAQLAATLNGGSPPDFAGAKLDERTLKGYVGHAGISESARQAFGYSL